MARLDPELKDFPGDIYVGLYRVRISKKVNGNRHSRAIQHGNGTRPRNRHQCPR